MNRRELATAIVREIWYLVDSTGRNAENYHSGKIGKRELELAGSDARDAYLRYVDESTRNVGIRDSVVPACQ